MEIEGDLLIQYPSHWRQSLIKPGEAHNHFFFVVKFYQGIKENLDPHFSESLCKLKQSTWDKKLFSPKSSEAKPHLLKSRWCLKPHGSHTLRRHWSYRYLHWSSTVRNKGLSWENFSLTQMVVFRLTCSSDFRTITRWVFLDQVLFVEHFWHQSSDVNYLSE